MCYPCSMCNKCGKVDRLRALENLCPKCKSPFEEDASICSECGYKRPKPPERPSA